MSPSVKCILCYNQKQKPYLQTAYSGDGWSVPVIGAVLTGLLSIILPYKLNYMPPVSLIHWGTHDDFPAPKDEWFTSRGGPLLVGAHGGIIHRLLDRPRRVGPVAIAESEDGETLSFIRSDNDEGSEPWVVANP